MEIHYSNTEMEEFLRKRLFRFQDVVVESEFFPSITVRTAYKLDWKHNLPMDLESHPQLYKMETVFHDEIKKAILKL